MNMTKVKTILFALCIVMLFTQTNSWSRRRRRRRSPPPCTPRDCTVSGWSYGSCSYPCGTSGIKWRRRRVITSQSCGGRCPYRLSEPIPCNRGDCANYGTPHSTGCRCRQGFTGTCCEHGKCISRVFQKIAVE